MSDGRPYPTGSALVSLARAHNRTSRPRRTSGCSPRHPAARSGCAAIAYYEAVDPNAPGEPVGFFGARSRSSPFWHGIAREYMERWVHHSQIRRAFGLGSLADEPFLRVGVEVAAAAAGVQPGMPTQPDDPWTLGPVVLGPALQAAAILTRPTPRTMWERLSAARQQRSTSLRRLPAVRDAGPAFYGRIDGTGSAHKQASIWSAYAFQSGRVPIAGGARAVWSIGPGCPALEHGPAATSRRRRGAVRTGLDARRHPPVGAPGGRCRRGSPPPLGRRSHRRGGRRSVSAGRSRRRTRP